MDVPQSRYECGELEKKVSELLATLAERDRKLAERTAERDAMERLVEQSISLETDMRSQLAASERQRKEMEWKLENAKIAMESAREALRGIVDLANINDFTRKILIETGNHLNREAQSLRSTPETPTA